MLSRIKIAACVASAVLIGPAVAPELLAAPASADTGACTPITIDGTAVACVSVAQSQEQDGSTQVTIGATVSDGSTTVERSVPLTVPAVDPPQPCVLTDGTSVYQADDPANRDKGGDLLLGVGVQDSRVGCHGVGLIVASGTVGETSLPTVTVGTATPVGTLPYHVPQICLTTTGTCVGPFDGTVTPEVPNPTIGGSPGVTPGSDTLCVATFQYDAWYDEYTYNAPLACQTVPLIERPSL